jgi:hypothetical protein
MQRKPHLIRSIKHYTIQCDRRRDIKETFKIELTIEETPRKRQKPTRSSAFQIEAAMKHVEICRKTQKKTATSRSTIISKQPSTL